MEPVTATPTFQVRPAEPDDIRPLAELWHDAFPGERTVGQRIRMLETGGRYGGLETVMVADEPGHGIVGAAKIYRMTEFIAGAPMPMMGLAAVAMAPPAVAAGSAPGSASTPSSGPPSGVT